MRAKSASVAGWRSSGTSGAGAARKGFARRALRNVCAPRSAAPHGCARAAHAWSERGAAEAAGAERGALRVARCAVARPHTAVHAAQSCMTALCTHPGRRLRLQAVPPAPGGAATHVSVGLTRATLLAAVRLRAAARQLLPCGSRRLRRGSP